MGAATVVLFFGRAAAVGGGKMDLLHVTPRALARVSCLSLLLENSPGRPLSITAVCPTSVSILNLLLTPLPFPSPRALSALLSPFALSALLSPLALAVPSLSSRA
jgi:hypothetical protein